MIKYINILLLSFILLIFLFIIWLSSCEDGCDTGDTRCYDSIVEVCNSDDNWEIVMKCHEVDPPELEWICCLSEYKIHTCVPKEKCEEINE